MLLYFLGTGAGKPSLKRNVSSVVLQLPEPTRELWLFDCGEGTQHQLLKSPLSLGKITRIFITHLHGDHIFGLPGLLGSRSFLVEDKPITVYGPSGIREFLDTALRTSYTNLSYPLHIMELSPSEELAIDNWQVKVSLVEHRVPSYGYRIAEPNSPGKLDTDKLQKLQVPPGPIYGKLKQGKTVVLGNGQVLDGNDFLGPVREGRHLVIVGDTRYCQATIDLAKNADVLVHEATFATAQEGHAYEYYHSTTTQAALVAKAANVKQLVLTHLSARYKTEELESILNEAKAIFPNTYLAEDHFSLAITRIEQLNPSKTKSLL